MSAAAVDQLATVRAYLRRKYWSAQHQNWDVAALRELADSAFAAGTRDVTINSTSTQAGGSASGEVTFNRLTLLAALEELLAEADPDNQPPTRPHGFSADFSQRPIST